MSRRLPVLAHAKRYKPGVLTKTSLMLGLGESDAEILETLEDLRTADVDIVTLGQYLRPTLNHLPVGAIRDAAGICAISRSGRWRSGFSKSFPGPLVRSSYRAERALERNNAGLEVSSAASG